MTQVEKVFTIVNINQLHNIMDRLDYLFPALVGVLAFGAAMQQASYFTAFVFMVMSVVCICLAVYERSKK